MKAGIRVANLISFSWISTAPAALREQLDTRKTLNGKATLRARLRPDMARLDELVATAAPATLSRLGCGTHHTATLLVAAGENINRFRSEAAFAHLCAVAPVPVSSGRTNRHRLDFAGNRAANRALHMIVIVRLRYCERARTRTYLNRRLAEGNTTNEANRCLKRFVAREHYHTLRADLATLKPHT